LKRFRPNAIKSIGKGVNKPGEYLEVVKKIHDHGIGIDGSFVFGFDTDDAGVFDRTVEFVSRPSSKSFIFPSSRRIPARASTSGSRRRAAC
jgi:radical SAM superfamily enzyme YgiQ (UPF0313 family)